MKLVSAAFLLLSTVYHQHFLAYFPSDNRMSADLTFIFITSNKQENLQNVGLYRLKMAYTCFITVILYMTFKKNLLKGLSYFQFYICGTLDYVD